ncbi:hypothetical protein [Pragia fontium]|uniref:hypothetical protein n=1 Tax=Pragia fontium TaxID=82985 RepID=UPI0011873FB8|nr:hypothetical protein [Pragia fontium]
MTFLLSAGIQPTTERGSTPIKDDGRGAASPGENQRRCVNPNEGGGESPTATWIRGRRRGSAEGVRLTPSARPRAPTLIDALH